MTYTEIDRADAKQIQEDLQETVKSFAQLRGLRLNPKTRCTYDAHSLMFRLTLEVPEGADNDSKVLYEIKAAIHNIEAPFGFSFEANGKTYTVSGWNKKAKKKFITYDISDGGTAKSTIAVLNNQWSRR